jgi:2-oxoglutarate ferredoxin oxidoreductase subunit alpha
MSGSAVEEQTGAVATATTVREHVVEIVSDAGEGAQRAGQAFGTISSKMGNSVWTVEIIPAEIEPPPRTAAGASGNRIRVGAFPITNAGDDANLICAFNEQALWGRVYGGNLAPDCIILLEDMWATHHDPDVVAMYEETCARIRELGYTITSVPMEVECKKIVSNPRRGKNMFMLGMLCSIYGRDLDVARRLIALAFRKKGEKVVSSNLELLSAGHAWAQENLDLRFDVPPCEAAGEQIVVNGNTALGLGIMAAGIEVCAMYPITPATSVSHYLCEVFNSVGGLVHQAEDEIAAIGFAVGASYSGKCAVTVTSGPGLALKTEFLALASMSEIPLVVIDVQRGGPSTGLPTKVEQSDLLAAIFAQAGDAPKVVLAAATIEDCFYSVITARRLAETFRMPVYVLSDANLATGQQPFARPQLRREFLAPAIDQSPVGKDVGAYDWAADSGLSRRLIPGQPGGMHTLTGLAHDRNSKVAYDPGINQEGCDYRSRKLAALQKTLTPPEVFGDPDGDLLLIGWGSTKGAIEEAVMRAREKGASVSALHLMFLNPLPSGIKEIIQRFRKAMTVEINYSDVVDGTTVTEENRRYANLAWLLRARYLLDIDCWSNVHGQPIKPRAIAEMIDAQIAALTTD